MNIYSIFGFAVVLAAIALLLKQYKPEFALVVSIGGCAVIFLLSVIHLQPVFTVLGDFAQRVDNGEQYIGTILKCLGICYLTSIASDTCKDAGQTAIAGKVELAGKITVVVLALPMFTSLVSLAVGLINI